MDIATAVSEHEISIAFLVLVTPLLLVTTALR
jgi:hypothetical protein